MSEISIILQMQLQSYIHNKGIVVFHLCVLAAIGIAAPLFITNDMVLLNAAFFFPLALQKQWALESFSEEKERRTLETLLSSPIKTKNLYYGKCSYCLLNGCGYFSIIMVLLVSLKLLIQAPFQLRLPEGACLLLLYIQASLTITMAGTQVSIYSENTQMAYSRFTIPFYTIYLYLFLVITLFTQQLELAAYLLSVVYMVVTLLINLAITFIKVSKLTRHNFLIK